MSRKPQKNALLVRQRHAIRELMVRGEIEEAGIKASEWGIDIEDCKLDADSNVPMEMALPPTESIAQVLAPKDPLPPLPNIQQVPVVPKWPVETDLVIEGQPINKRMALVRLPDNRKSLMWKRGNNFPVGSKVRAKLCDQVGPDAYYEPAVNG